MDHVFATDSRIVSHPKTGIGVGVGIGEHWAADDPVVKAYPNLFTDDARYGLRSSSPLGEDGYPVGEAAPKRPAAATETTSAAPGEKRSRDK